MFLSSKVVERVVKPLFITTQLGKGKIKSMIMMCVIIYKAQISSDIEDDRRLLDYDAK